MLLDDGTFELDTGMLLLDSGALLQGDKETTGVEEGMLVTVTVTGGEGGLDAVTVLVVV